MNQSDKEEFWRRVKGSIFLIVFGIAAISIIILLRLFGLLGNLPN